MPPGSPVRGLKTGLIIAIVIAALEGIVIVALVIALAANGTNSGSRPIGSTVASSGPFNQSMGTVVYSSTFGSDENWLTGNVNANTNISLANGLYVVQAWSEIHHLLFTPYDVGHLGISVQAGATDFSPDDLSMGVGCQSESGISPPLVYQLVVYPDGDWWLEEGRVGGEVETLRSGSSPTLGNTATFQLTCVVTRASSDSQVTQLVGYVNDTQLVAVGDRIANLSIGGYIPVLVVGSFGPHVHTAFDGISVRSITPQSVAAP
jgi:hypothetical protein